MSYTSNNPRVISQQYRPQSADPANPTEGQMFYADGTSRIEGLWVYKNAAWRQIGPDLSSQYFIPQAADPSSPVEGQVFYSDGTSREEGLWVYKNGAWTTIGSSGGGLNYILNSDFSSGTTGYATYADAAGAAPVDGTGGSANITFTATTVTPLRGTQSGLITKDAVNRQGQGTSYNFSIDRADQAKVLRISFDYETSVNYADGDIRVYVYDVTNSRVIEVVDRDLLANNLGQYIGSFQSSPDSTSYRLIFHAATVSALAYTVEIDSVSVAPQVLSSGVVVTDWQPSTVTTAITNTTITSSERRVGDTVFITGVITCTAAPGGTFTLAFPYIIDDAKLDRNSSTDLGSIMIATASRYQGRIRASGTANGALLYDNGAIMGSVSATTPATLAVGHTINFEISYPVLGWSSNMQISENLGNREVVFRGYLAAATNHTTLGTYTTVPIDTVSIDTVAGFSLGSNGYVIQEAGYYDISGQCAFTSLASGGTGALIEIDSGIANYFGNRWMVSSAVAAYSNVSVTIYLTKGQLVTLKALQTDSASEAYSVAASRNYLCVAKRASPQTLAGGEVVACRYTSNSGQAVTSGNNIVYEDKVFDTHNSYNVSTGVWTCPMSGYYIFQNSYEASAFIATAGQYLITNLVNITQSVSSYLGLNYIENTSNSIPKTVSGSGTIYCNKGDSVVFRFVENSPATNLTTDTLSNHMSITKVG